MNSSILTFAALALTLLSTRAENWPRFRGPTGQGLSKESNPPTRWSAIENVAWKTPIPGEGWSSPVIWSDRVFLTVATDGGASCHVLCLEAETGKILWDREVFRQELLRKENKNSYASPTPCLDGERVYAVFNDGSAAAVTFQGEVAWTNREIKHYSRHGLGASPVLHDGLLVMAYDGSKRVDSVGKWPEISPDEKIGWQVPWEEAQVVAFDAKTGQRRWIGKRGLSRVAHVSPNVVDVNGQAQIVSPAGDVIQGFAPKTGERLWSIRSEGEGVSPSFAFGDGLIFTASGFGKPTVRTVKMGAQGEASATHVAWESNKSVPSQSSLLYVAPYLYSVTDAGVVACHDGKTGEVMYRERIGGNHCASPVHAAGRIYFLSEEGECVVIKAGKEFEIIARNEVGEKCQASIALADGRLYLRGEKHLFAIREPK